MCEGTIKEVSQAVVSVIKFRVDHQRWSHEISLRLFLPQGCFKGPLQHFALNSRDF